MVSNASFTTANTNNPPMKLPLFTLGAGIVAIAGHTFPVHAADPYAKAVVRSEILDGNIGNSRTDPGAALGPPDETNVSLGGPGASILLDMGEDTLVVNGPGPDLEVREIGAAFGGVDESYRVLVSNSTEPETFVFVGEGRALSLIDIAPSGLESIRYVWIQDLATETLNTQTPGSDIDSVRSLYGAGAGDDLPPPADVRIRLTSQGALISWSAPQIENVTGYAIRRSLDGISFGSSPDASLSADETAWLDTSATAVQPVFHAVSVRSGDEESRLMVVGIPVTTLPVPSAEPVHIGDDPVPAWERPEAVRTYSWHLTLPPGLSGGQAALDLEVFDIDYSTNPLIVNGVRAAALPTHGSENWASRSVSFPASLLKPGANTFTIAARASNGAASGQLDDFMVRNLALRLLLDPEVHGVHTATRFTRVEAGATTVTLRWVVEQTPTLAPPKWETVSGPIEWTASVTAEEGYFRLNERP